MGVAPTFNVKMRIHSLIEEFRINIAEFEFLRAGAKTDLEVHSNAGMAYFLFFDWHH